MDIRDNNLNIINGKISEIESEGQLSIVSVRAKSNTFKAVVIDSPEQNKNLVLGNNVKLLFKETEVVISKEKIETISSQNQIACEIKSINAGKLLSEISLISDEGNLVSIITSKSVKRLGLTVGDTVSALIKTNEIMLLS